MEKITYEKLTSLTDVELVKLTKNVNVTYDMLPILTEEQRDVLYPTLGDYFDGIYGIKFGESFIKEFNLSPTREIANFKGYLSYLKENIKKIKEKYDINNENSILLEKLDKNISDIMFDNKILSHDKAKNYINYLWSSILKIESELKTN